MGAGLLLFVTAALTEIVAGKFFSLFAIVLILVAIALPALHSSQTGRDGRLGTIGTWLGSLGAAAIAAFVGLEAYEDLIADRAVFGEGTEALILLGGLAFGVGMILFAVALFRGRVFPRAASSIFLAGVLIFVLAEFAEQIIGSGEESGVPLLADVLPIVGIAFWGFGLIWIGYLVWAERIPPNSSGS